MEDIKYFRKKMRLLARVCIAVMFMSFATIMISLFRETGYSPLFILVSLCCFAGMICCVILFIAAVFIREKSDFMDDQLKENQQKYKLIISASNTGAWEYHADSKVEWCSAEYFKMLGYDENEFFKGKNVSITDIWTSLLHPDDKEQAIRKFNDYLANDSVDLYENYFRLRHKNGNWIWIWSRGQTLKRSDGTRSKVMLGTHIDVTERKNLEIALLKLNETLFNYAHLNAHKVRGPLARLLGLIEVSKMDEHLDYKWCFHQIGIEASEVDRVLRKITAELSEIEYEENARMAI